MSDNTAPRAPAPIVMWAAIVPSKRCSWIHWGTLSRTRRGARQKYLEQWDPAHRANIIKRHGVTFRRVIVAVQEEA